MPETWRTWSERAVGYIATQTPKIEYQVALYKIQSHINEGYSDADIALIWNQGNAGPCKIGVNNRGVKYNSCSYRDAILAYLQ